MAIFLYLLCFLLSCVFLHHIVSQLSRRYRRFPPGPTPLPIIGNLLNLGAKPHISLAHLAKVHGPVMSLQLGSLTTIVISSSSSAKEVMQKRDTAFATLRTIPDAIHACNHSGLSMAWLPLDGMGKNLRKIATSQVLASGQLDAMSDLRQEKVNDLLLHVDSCSQAGVPVHIAQVAFTTALNMLSCMFFSTDLAKLSTSPSSGPITNSSDASYGEVDGTEFKEMMTDIMVECGKPNLSDFFPSLRRFDLQGRRRALGVHFSRMLSCFDRLIDKRMDTGISSGRDHDLLDALLKISQENINGFDRPFIPHMLADMYMGGTDTTSTTIEWVMSELLRNPTKMKKAQKELEEVIGRNNHVQEAHISKLPYLQAVLKESMRLHPPVPLLVPRKASSNVDVSGFLVPKGSQVWVNVRAIQRDPAVWEDANAFKPERFLGSSIDLKGLNFELTPFGAGRRICPGMPLTVRFVQLLLASLVHSYDWTLEDKTIPECLDMEETFGMTLHKTKPLRAIPKRRS